MGATVTAASFTCRAQSGKVFKSEYITAPQVGNVIQTTAKVKIVGPIPAIPCKSEYFYES